MRNKNLMYVVMGLVGLFCFAGLPVYVSTTAGLMTETAPDGSGDQVQIIGYTESGNVLRVKPCLHIDAVE